VPIFFYCKMKLVLGSIVSDLSGSVGGCTVQHRSGQLVLSAVAKPRNNITQVRYMRSSDLSVWSRGWRSLTSAQRSYFKSWSQLYCDANGDHVSPYNLYMSYCSVLSKRRIVAFTMPNFRNINPDFRNTQNDFRLALQRLNVYFTAANDINAFVFVAMSRPFTRQTDAYKYQCKQIGSMSMGVLVFSNFWSAYVAIFGAILYANCYVNISVTFWARSNPLLITPQLSTVRVLP